MLEVLQSAADHLRDREQETLEGEVVRGFITKCERGADASSGTVVVEGWSRGARDTDERVRCTVELAGPDYEAAVAAHADRLFVSLEGTVHRVGRSWRMDGVSRLRVEAQREFEGPRLGLNPPDEG